MNEQTFLFEDNAEYDAFVEKFKPKKTTDDCYTPTLVYDAIRDWACNEYRIEPDSIVMPFYPGGDYEHYEYPDGCVVLDNPPFSILSKIISFYDSKHIKFFLFAPALTLLSPVCDGYCGIAVGASITYENGAKVSTSFVTNLERNVARTSPELYKIITEENKKNERKLHRELPKYDYPDNVITATFLQKLSKYGISFSVQKNESVRISALDMQKENKKSIFGKGLLCSDRVAAEKAAAEKAAAEKAAAEKAAAEKAAAEKENKVIWSISERERKIIEDFVNADKR